MKCRLLTYPHPPKYLCKNLGRARNIPALWIYLTRLKRLPRWVDLGKQLFDEVLNYGGIWHLYGHSWEIDELAIWRELREMLDYACNRDGVQYLTNGQLLSTVSAE